MTEPTLKQWKRRALAAEGELDTIKGMRQFDTARGMDMARENAVLRVVLREIQDSPSPCGYLGSCSDQRSLSLTPDSQPFKHPAPGLIPLPEFLWDLIPRARIYPFSQSA